MIFLIWSTQKQLAEFALLPAGPVGPVGPPPDPVGPVGPVGPEIPIQQFVLGMHSLDFSIFFLAISYLISFSVIIDNSQTNGNKDGTIIVNNGNHGLHVTH